MKTEYREHPLGAPGLAAGPKVEPSEPEPPRSLLQRARRLLARLASRVRVR